MKYVKAFIVGPIVGLVLAGIKGLHDLTVPSLDDVLAITGITTFAVLLLTFLDSLRSTRRDNFQAIVEDAPPEGIPRVCANAYSLGAFECWKPVQKSEGARELEAERILEHKTWSFHRAIVFAKGGFSDASFPEQFQTALRESCRRILTPSRWKGLGLGCVVRCGGAELPKIESLLSAVDTKAKFPATIQWIVAVEETTRRALAVHTFMDVALTPSFAASCEYLKTNGYALECQKCERPGLLKIVNAIHGE